MPQYCIQLGRTPELSLAELQAVFTSMDNDVAFDTITREVAIFTTQKPLPADFLSRLGGSIKLAEVLREIPPKEVLEFVDQYITYKFPLPQGRITLGFSTLTLSQNSRLRQSEDANTSASRWIHAIALEVKKSLKSYGYSIRVVTPQRNEASLSSVVVSKNGLTDESGVEFLLLQGETTTCVARTLEVQDFESYSERDFGRPSRAMTTGLLPPKLAQTLLNLAGIDPNPSSVVLDPFCGFGTVIQEALRMGFREVYGSDLKPQRVDDTKENISWGISEGILPDSFDVKSHLSVQNATNLSKLKARLPAAVDAIVSEPFLGPTITDRSTDRDIARAKTEVETLLRTTFSEFKKILAPGGRVSIIFPAWQYNGERFFVDILPVLQALGFHAITPMPPAIKNWPAMTKRGSILYTREGQKVAREIFVFTLK